MLNIDVEQNLGIENVNNMQKHFAADKESALVTEMFDIFICMYTTSVFGDCFDTDISVSFSFCTLHIVSLHFCTSVLAGRYCLVTFIRCIQQLQIINVKAKAKDLFSSDKAKVKDAQPKSESLCRCSANLCTLCQRISLTDTGTATFSAILHKNDAANNKQYIILATSFIL